MTYYQYHATFALTVRNTKQRLSNRLLPTMCCWREFWVIDDSVTRLYQMQKNKQQSYPTFKVRQHAFGGRVANSRGPNSRGAIGLRVSIFLFSFLFSLFSLCLNNWHETYERDRPVSLCLIFIVAICIVGVMLVP